LAVKAGKGDQRPAREGRDRKIEEAKDRLVEVLENKRVLRMKGQPHLLTPVLVCFELQNLKLQGLLLLATSALSTHHDPSPGVSVCGHRGFGTGTTSAGDSRGLQAQRKSVKKNVKKVSNF